MSTVDQEATSPSGLEAITDGLQAITPNQYPLNGGGISVS